MMKIGEVTARYGMSHRTLRFWEENGLIESIRTESGYRQYDEDNLRKIRQAIILRKLDLPLADIEAIFRSGSLEVAIQVVKKQLDRVKKQSESLKTTRLLLEYLIGLLESRKSLREMFATLEASDSAPLSDLARSLESASQKASEPMNQNDILIRNDLRIVQLPPMIFASATSETENPEDAAWEKIHHLTVEYHLDSHPGFRNLGYGYYKANGTYVYTVWITIPRDLILPAGYERVEFRGGLFAALPCSLMNIGERWNELVAMVTESDKYVSDEARPHGFCFEEVLDQAAFFAPDAPISDRQLDLFLPIKKVETKAEAPILRPEIVELPEVLL